MSMLTSQCNELRTTAVRLERMMRGEFDAISLSSIPTILRHAADTIESLHNRSTETCHMVLKDDHEVYGEAFYIWWECDECGCTLTKSFGMPEIRYCPNCGRKVVE